MRSVNVMRRVILVRVNTSMKEVFRSSMNLLMSQKNILQKLYEVKMQEYSENMTMKALHLYGTGLRI
ncbi:MAG: hypothetical protein IPM96_18975 [Ignavibacteria bacterium]|nr:hypothetical protein [Ignavibacteria bacterium]